MKEYKTENLRNILVGAHGGAGKTSLVEAMAYNMGVANRIGTIESGSTISDYNEEEIERQVSISASLIHGEVNNQKLNIIDTPGYSDFFGEVVGALRAADGVMIVISASGGVEVGTELVWNEAIKLNLPRFFVINKLDKENINFDEIMEHLRETFGHSVVAAQFPVETGPGFSKVVDLIRRKVFKYSTDGKGSYTEEDIPGDLSEKFENMYVELVETVAESDEELMEKYLEAGELTEDEFREGLKKAIIADNVFPVFCVSATDNIGVKRLNELIANFMPSPLEMPEVAGLDDKKRKMSDDQPVSALVF